MHFFWKTVGFQKTSLESNSGLNGLIRSGLKTHFVTVAFIQFKNYFMFIYWGKKQI